MSAGQVINHPAKQDRGDKSREYAGILAVLASSIIGLSYFADQGNFLDPVVVIFLVTIPAILFYISRWSTAGPDQWQLLIRNGSLVSAGVGSTHFRALHDTVVRFPSMLQKVPFEVTQITREMQGIKVSGFAMWSVHREGDGPWRAYRSLLLRDKDGDGVIDSAKGSDSIRNLAISIVRVSVANTNLSQVLSERDTIRDHVRNEMMKQLPGWGAWLETVEISDVTVCSKSLFEDLQAPYRAEMRLSAEETRLKTNQALTLCKSEAQAKNAQVEADAKVAQHLAEQGRQMREMRDREDFRVEEAKLLMERNETQKQMRLAEIERDTAIALAIAEKEAAIAKIAARQRVEEQELQDARRRMIVSGEERDVLRIETLKDIYDNLPLREMKVHNVVSGGDAGSGNAAGLLPGLGPLVAGFDVLKSSGM